MNKFNIINNPEFNEAVMECTSRSVNACIACGASYDEMYLMNKWEKRLLDAYDKKCNTSEKLVAYAEKSFSF